MPTRASMSRSASWVPSPAPRPARSSPIRSYTSTSQPAARSRCAANNPPSEPPMISARRRIRSPFLRHLWRARPLLHALTGELALERGHHLAGEELQRAGGVGKLHRAEHHLAEQIIDTGLALKILEIIAHGRRRTGDSVADRLQFLEGLGVDAGEHEVDLRALPQESDCLAPRQISLARDALRRGIGLGDHDVPGDADHRQILALAPQLAPLLAIANGNVARARGRAERDHVDRSEHTSELQSHSFIS